MTTKCSLGECKANLARSVLVTILPCVHAAFSMIMGVCFIIRQENMWYPRTTVTALIGVMLSMYSNVCRWQLVAFEGIKKEIEDKHKYSFLLFPCIAFVTFCLGAALENRINASTLTVYIVHTVLWSRLNFLWEHAETYLSQKGGESYPRGKRFTIFYPLLFMAIQSVLFGACLMEAEQGFGGALLYTICTVTEYLIWTKLLDCPQKTFTDWTTGILTAVSLICMLYFSVYYNVVGMGETGSPWFAKPWSVYAKIVSLAVYCGGVIAIPGIAELVRIAGLSNRSPVLEILHALSAVLVFVSWVWIAFSTAYLVIFAAISAFWTITNYSRNKVGGYKFAAAVFALWLIFTAGTLCVEFLGLLSNCVPQGSGEDGGRMIQVIAAIAPSVVALLPIKGKAPPEKWPTDMVMNGTLYYFALTVTAILMVVFRSMGINPQRTNFACGVVLTELILVVAVRVFLWVTKHIEDSKEKQNQQVDK